MDVKSWIIGKLDVNADGKVDLKDVEAKLGMSFVHGFIVGAGCIGMAALVLVKILK